MVSLTFSSLLGASVAGRLGWGSAAGVLFLIRSTNRAEFVSSIDRLGSGLLAVFARRGVGGGGASSGLVEFGKSAASVLSPCAPDTAPFGEVDVALWDTLKIRFPVILGYLKMGRVESPIEETFVGPGKVGEEAFLRRVSSCEALLGTC